MQTEESPSAGDVLDDLSKARLWLLECREYGMPQGIVLLLLVVGIISRLATCRGSAVLIARLIEVWVVHQDHALNADQYLQHTVQYRVWASGQALG